MTFISLAIIGLLGIMVSMIPLIRREEKTYREIERRLGKIELLLLKGGDK